MAPILSDLAEKPWWTFGMVNDRLRIKQKIAIVLGGGGAKGDFEVGALTYLYEYGFQPQIICGTSVGAINAAKLAEGSTAINELADIWLSLNSNNDMFLEEPWLQVLEPKIREFLRLSAADVIEGSIKFALDPLEWIPDLAALGIEAKELMAALEQAKQAKHLYNLMPIANKLNVMLSGGKIQSSGIQLRLAVVNLESGELQYINETGQLLNMDGAPLLPVNIVEAVLASAAIPTIFPMIKLGSNNYVDGGIREIIPVKAAIDLGANQIFAILSAPAVPATGSFDDKNIFDIGLRSIDIMTDEIMQNDTKSDYVPRNPLFNPVTTVIQPTINVHDGMTIDPGLISISIAYGYMRAADILIETNIRNPTWADKEAVRSLKFMSDKITALRKEIWDLEYDANGVLRNHLNFKNDGLQPVPDPDVLRSIREKKKILKYWVEQRQTSSGALPSDYATWWKNWERHPWQPYTQSPWSRFSSPIGIVEEEPAP